MPEDEGLRRGWVHAVCAAAFLVPEYRKGRGIVLRRLITGKRVFNLRWWPNIKFAKAVLNS